MEEKKEKSPKNDRAVSEESQQLTSHVPAQVAPLAPNVPEANDPTDPLLKLSYKIVLYLFVCASTGYSIGKKEDVNFLAAFVLVGLGAFGLFTAGIFLFRKFKVISTTPEGALNQSGFWSSLTLLFIALACSSMFVGFALENNSEVWLIAKAVWFVVSFGGLASWISIWFNDQLVELFPTRNRNTWSFQGIALTLAVIGIVAAVAAGYLGQYEKSKEDGKGSASAVQSQESPCPSPAK